MEDTDEIKKLQEAVNEGEMTMEEYMRKVAEIEGEGPSIFSMLAQQAERRFEKGERVICKLPDVGWAPGKVAELNEPDPQDELQVLPYVGESVLPCCTHSTLSCDFHW